MNTRDTEPIAWSDDLAPLIELLREYGDLFPLREILQINLIVDANIILPDLRWLELQRRDSTARTYLLEVLEANTLIVYAPSFLETEIKEKLPDMAHKDGIDLRNLAIQWKKYQKYIKFIDVGGPDNSYDDPYDAPYMKLQAKLNIPILSEDRDISRMGGRVIETTVIARLRSYSRDAAVEYSLVIAGYGVISLSDSLLKATSDLLASLVESARKLPQWVYALILVGVIALLAYPKSREWLKGIFQELPEKSKSLGKKLIDQVGPLLVEYDRAKGAAAKERSSIENELSKGG